MIRLVSFNAPSSLQPRQLGIGFDTETWDFMIFENGVCVGALEPGESAALLDAIKRATSNGDGKHE